MIFLGDYLELMKSLEDESIDLVLTDPPFGVNYQSMYRTSEHSRQKEKIVNDDRDFGYAELANEAWRLLKPGSAFFAFTGWSRYPWHFQNVEQAGFKMRQPLICQKRAGSASPGSFQSNCDWIIFAVKGGFQFETTTLVRNRYAGQQTRYYNSRGETVEREPTPYFKRVFPSAWFGPEYPCSSENPATLTALGEEHPTVKSVTFLEWIIQLCSKEGAVVLDPFCGTGTTALAALNTGRRFIVGDIYPDYYSRTKENVRARMVELGYEEKDIP